MLRIATVSGTAQLLFLCAALQNYSDTRGVSNSRDILLMSGENLPEDRRNAMLAIANAAWLWQEIIFVDEYLRPSDKNMKASPDKVSKLLEKYGEADEIWFCMPHEIEAKTLMRIYPSAMLHYYDDGVGTYLDLYNGLELLKHPRRLMKFLFYKFLRNSRGLQFMFPAVCFYYPVREIAILHLLLSPPIDLPVHFRSLPCASVSSDVMLKVVKRIKSELGFASTKGLDFDNCRRVLVLGQFFCEGAPDLWVKEYAVYANAIKRLKNEGFEVWWKEHPKAKRPFGERFHEDGLVVEFMEVNDVYPIELIVDENFFEKCISISSTGLLTLWKIYKIEPVSLAKMINFKIHGANRIVNKMFIDKVAGVDFLT